MENDKVQAYKELKKDIILYGVKETYVNGKNQYGFKESIESKTYNITIKNKTDKTILLSEGIDGNDICLIDSNEVEYDSILNEIPLVNLELKPGMEKTIDIRFYKMYNLYRTIESINFKNIIADKDSYDINKENANKVNISIDI